MPVDYMCPVCGVQDRFAYLRCNRGDCLDGRDQHRVVAQLREQQRTMLEPRDHWRVQAFAYLCGGIFTAIGIWLLGGL